LPTPPHRRTGRAGRAERSGSNPGCSGPADCAPRHVAECRPRCRSENTAQPAALLSAAASGDTTQTAALLNQGAALEARDDAGRTPLMLAVNATQAGDCSACVGSRRRSECCRQRRTHTAANRRSRKTCARLQPCWSEQERAKVKAGIVLVPGEGSMTRINGKIAMALGLACLGFASSLVPAGDAQNPPPGW